MTVPTTSAENMPAESHPSRRTAIQRIAAGAALAASSGSLAQAQGAAHPAMNAADFARLQKELSNWNRWGADDQKGTYNLITPAKRKQAVALVREGYSVSMARNEEYQPSADNPQPMIRKTLRAGTTAPAVGVGGTADSVSVAYHGYAHTHMDTLCHFLYDGKMYNGYPASEVTDDGAMKNSIINFKDGVITRGVLMDMARYKGVDFLEPGTPIYPEDLEGWEKMAGVKVQSGDVMLVRTGRWKRRDLKGAWSVQKEGLAGLHMSCAKWNHSRDIAILGGDGAQDVLPSQVDGVSQPIHGLTIVAMGTPIFDNCDLEQVAVECAKRKRWEFLVTASPAATPMATGSMLNPIATF